MSKYVAYFRVSTTRQGQSGLGLEAQQAAVLRFLPREAIRVADYIEVESGRKSARPQLLAAIALAQREEAVLLVAKLDRLTSTLLRRTQPMVLLNWQSVVHSGGTRDASLRPA